MFWHVIQQHAGILGLQRPFQGQRADGKSVDAFIVVDFVPVKGRCRMGDNAHEWSL